jgi:hypothetical protein
MSGILGAVVHTLVANELLKEIDYLCSGFVIHTVKRTLRTVVVKDALLMCECLLDLGTR